MCGAPSETGLAERLLSDDPSRFDSAQKLFAQICASGHGDRGDSDWPVGAAQALALTDFNIQQPSSITRVWCRAKGSRARRSRGWWPPGAKGSLEPGVERALQGPLTPLTLHRLK